MADDDVLERYLSSARPNRPGVPPAATTAARSPSDVVPDDAAPTTEDVGCFGYLRGMRERAVMLELRRRTGDVLAIAYGFVDRILYDPSEGITIHAGGQTVRIRGMKLNSEVRPNVRLFEGLARHRVSWVREQPADPTPPDSLATLITRLEW